MFKVASIEIFTEREKMKRFLQNSGSSKLLTKSFTENPEAQQSV